MPWKRILLEGDAATLTSTVTPVAVDFGAAAIGTSTEAARADHKHSAVAGSPVALDGLAADGTSTAFVRADHKHALGPLAVDLNFNEHEADKLALDNLSAAAAYTTTKLGVVYFDTVDRHPYIYIG
jgi:hypothetical protein